MYLCYLYLCYHTINFSVDSTFQFSINAVDFSSPHSPCLRLRHFCLQYDSLDWSPYSTTASSTHSRHCTQSSGFVIQIRPKPLRLKSFQGLPNDPSYFSIIISPQYSPIPLHISACTPLSQSYRDLLPVPPKPFRHFLMPLPLPQMPIRTLHLKYSY